VRLEELVEPGLVDTLLEPVVAVELEVVVLVDPGEIADDVAVEEDDTVDVRTVDEADCVTVLLPDRIALLLVDDVPLKLPVAVVMAELLGGVEVGDAVVVPLNVKTDEDEEPAVEEVLPYGAPLVIVLEANPLEGPVA
jgi:hypothetical protein